MSVAAQTEIPDDSVSYSFKLDAHDPYEAAGLLEALPDPVVVKVLSGQPAERTQAILDNFARKRREAIVAALPVGFVEREWLESAFPESSVGRLMAPAIAQFSPDMTVADAVSEMRGMLNKGFFSYGYVVDTEGRLLGALVMRDMLLASPDAKLEDIMIRKPFSLRPEMPLVDAMKVVLDRHYPDYPVVDEAGHLLGVVRGETLFKAQTVEISAQAGSMVGVDKEERINTIWGRCFKLRHPWLQLNLFTAFLAGAVVGIFQDTIDKIVVLAAFLPVLAGQAGNTGCQSLAVTLRGLTLGELKGGGIAKLISKEAWLGLLNGGLVGVTAAIGMFIFANMQGDERALTLSIIVFLAMIGSCVISGVFGALVPVVLRRLGTEPATASSIFVTTATDVASLSLLLGIATIILL